MSLRDRILHLAHSEPELRPHLVPLLREKRSGILEAPPRMLAKALGWAVSTYTQDFLNKRSWDATPEIEKMVTQRVRPFNKRATLRIPLDLTGWKHQARFKGMDPGPYSQVIISLVRQMADADGYFDPLPKPRIVIGVTGDYFGHNFNFLSEVRTLKITIRHELQHFTQYFMQHVLGQPGQRDSFAPHVPSAGFPSSGSMTPEFTQELDNMTNSRRKYVRRVLQKAESLGLSPGHNTLHSLDDVEFYSRLADTVEKFRAGSKDMDRDEKAKWVKWYTSAKVKVVKPTPGQRRPRMRARPPWELSEHVGHEPSTFFRNLKKGAPQKYKKALKEFVKAVL